MEPRLPTARHDRAVNRIVRLAGQGDNSFRALPAMYRIFEGVRHTGNRSDVPGVASQRRVERSKIYADAQARLGETAHFAVLLMWVPRDDIRLLVAESLQASDASLIDPQCGLLSIDYEEGKDNYASHADWLVVTDRDNLSTGARLKPHDTSMYVAYSLVHSKESVIDDPPTIDSAT